MDAQHFDALARVLSTGHRRGLLGALLTLPVLGGLAGVIAIDEADAQRGAGTGKNDNDDVAADKNKNTNKRRKKQCKKKTARACDGGRCGTVTIRCKKGKGKKAKQQRIDCGPCAVCEPACEGGQCCDQGACVVDCPAGQLCQADGTCGVPACDVCETGCPFSSVQDAIDAADPGDTITICAGTYQEGAELRIDTSLTLIGAGDGETGTIFDGQGQHRVVHVDAGTTVVLQGLRLTGGNSAGGGGGIRNSGQVTLTGCTVIANASPDDGGGLYNDIGGEMTLTGCTVSENTASASGGILTFGTLTLTDSTVRGNTASAGDGGGISNAGSLTLTDSTVRDNTATIFGGGIENAGTLTLTNSTVSGNTAGDDSGGISNVGTLTLSDSTVSGNTAGDDGGGIFNVGTLTLSDSTVSGNTATESGGGILNFTGGTVNLEGDSHVCANTANGVPSNCEGFSDPACMEPCPA